MTVEITEEEYTVELLRNNPNKIFVFGDNLKRYGKIRQAIIRGEPNAFGIATKREPSMEPTAFFSDRIDEMHAVTNDLERLFFLSMTKDIVFPSSGIGTGLSRLKQSSPFIWSSLNTLLLFYFNFKNPE